MKGQRGGKDLCNKATNEFQNGFDKLSWWKKGHQQGFLEDGAKVVFHVQIDRREEIPAGHSFQTECSDAVLGMYRRGSTFREDTWKVVRKAV